MPHETGAVRPYPSRVSIRDAYESGHLSYNEAQAFLTVIIQGQEPGVALTEITRMVRSLLGGLTDSEIASDPEAGRYGYGTATPVPRVGEPPPANVRDLLDDPGLYTALYEQAQGIPTSGRSMYQGWLANQAIVPIAEHNLRQDPMLGLKDPESQRFPDQTFQEYMIARRGQPTTFVDRSYFDALTGLSPNAQQAAIERLPEGQRDQIQRALVRGALRSQGASRHFARALTEQAFRRRGQFAVSDEGVAGGSFLDYLKRTYPLDPAVGG